MRGLVKSDIYVASKSLAIILIVIGSVLLSSLTVVNNDNDSNCLSYCHVTTILLLLPL